MELRKPTSLSLSPFRVGLEKNVYYPGEVMRGVVIKNVGEPEPCTSIVVWIYGVTKTHYETQRFVCLLLLLLVAVILLYWIFVLFFCFFNYSYQLNRTEHYRDSEGNQRTRTVTDHHYSSAKILDIKYVLWRSNDKKKIDTGAYTWPFELVLPGR